MIRSAWGKLRSSNATLPAELMLVVADPEDTATFEEHKISSSLKWRWTGANPMGTRADHEDLPAGDVGTERTFSRFPTNSILPMFTGMDDIGSSGDG